MVNERFDLLAWNAAYAALWPGMIGAAPGERNTLWQCFTLSGVLPSRTSTATSSWPPWSPSSGGPTAGTSASPPGPGSSARLQALSPHFARLWAEHDVASPASYLKIFRHPAYDALVMKTTSLAVLAMPGTRVVVYTPADETCRVAIGKLLAGEGTDAHYPCWPAHRRRRAELAAACGHS